MLRDGTDECIEKFWGKAVYFWDFFFMAQPDIWWKKKKEEIERTVALYKNVMLSQISDQKILYFTVR